MGPVFASQIGRLGADASDAYFEAWIHASFKCFIGGPEVNRTPDTRFRKPLLYPLSYGAGPAKYNSRGFVGALASLNRDWVGQS